MKSKKLVSVFGGIAVAFALAFASAQAFATSSQPVPVAGCDFHIGCTYGGYGFRMCCDPI